MILYIAGPMTHLPDYNRPVFNAAETRLQAAGYTTLNPARTVLGPDATWQEYMHVGLRQVLDADGIALLPDWERSRGAKLEEHVATALGKPTEPLHYWIEHPSTPEDDLAIYPLGTIGGEG